jgi:hypothetical protein
MSNSTFNPNFDNCAPQGMGQGTMGVRATSSGMALPPGELKIAPGSALVINALGQLDIDCNILAKRCRLKSGSNFNDSGDCGVTWSATPTQVAQNQPITVSLAGLSPFSTMIVLVSGPNGSYSNVQMQADNTGTIGGLEGAILMDGPEGNYTIQPLVPGCKLTPAVINASVVNFAAQEACKGFVSVTPVFSDSQVSNGSTVNFTLQVQNTNAGAVTVTLPPMTLPAGLQVQGSAPQINNLVVNGNTSESVSFILKGANVSVADLLESISILPGQASYVCGGSIRSAGGGQANITVKAPPAPACGIAITSLVFNTAAVSSGGSATLTLKIKNIGTSAVTNFNGTSAVTGAGITFTPSVMQLSAANLTIGAGQEVTLTASGNFTLEAPVTTLKTATALVQAGNFNGICGGTNITTSNTFSSSLSVTP